MKQSTRIWYPASSTLFEKQADARAGFGCEMTLESEYAGGDERQGTHYIFLRVERVRHVGARRSRGEGCCGGRGYDLAIIIPHLSSNGFCSWTNR